ncbi:MAG TPA: SRPBCC family protein [Polyangiaceae bacterium]|nr:SRPBCC family protein [Polyangiaceae bacterium]
MAQIVVGALLAVGFCIVGLGALLPRDWRVEESILINAPAPVVHAWVGDLQRWPRWAQWNQAALWPKNQVSDPSTGVGATLRWYGRAPSDDELQSGEVRIVRSDPQRGVWFENRIQNHAPSQASVTYSERAGVTQVTWQDRGQLPLIVGGLFRDLFQKRLREHMVSGLERLHDLVGASSNTDRPAPSSGPERPDAGSSAPRTPQLPDAGALP